MEIIAIYTNSPLRNFTYILASPPSRKAIVVDPFYPEQALNWAEENGYKLDFVINTHEHHDHTCGNLGLLPHLEKGVFCHPHSRSKIPTSTHSLELEEKIYFGDSWIQILDTPGHTMGHVSLLVGYKENPEAILTGDTLFNAGVGNCKNGGDPHILYQTIVKKFRILPDSVKVYPGHDYWENNLSFTLFVDPRSKKAMELLEEYKSELKKGRFLVSTLGLEKEVSLFFRLQEDKDWKQGWDAGVSGLVSDSLPKEEKIFLKLRKLRDSW